MDDDPRRVPPPGAEAPRTVLQVDPVITLRALDRAVVTRKGNGVAPAQGPYRFRPDRHSADARPGAPRGSNSAETLQDRNEVRRAGALVIVKDNVGVGDHTVRADNVSCLHR
jgi:hypothetical protein